MDQPERIQRALSEDEVGMRGTMLWFNEDKGHGFIRTEEGERLLVEKDGFAGGKPPVGRCAGLPVEFTRRAGPGAPRAIDTVLVEHVEPRRARLRRGGSSIRS